MCMDSTGMAISRLEDKICSVKKTEDDGEGGSGGGASLIECLRGRLLAERQASRAAKDDAEFMVQKLTELEKKLREEIRLRDKAERRLKFLKGKLETTVNIPSSPTLEESEESRRSPITSGPDDAQLGRAKTQITEQETSQNSKIGSSNRPKSSDHSRTHEAILDWETGDFPAEKSGQQITAGDGESKIDGHLTEQETSQNSKIGSSNRPKSSDHSRTHEAILDWETGDFPAEKSGQRITAGDGFSKIDDHSSSMSKAPVAEPETQSEIDKEAHSSQALVPIELPGKTQPQEMKITRKIASQALDPLIHAREKTQSSMEKRHMVDALIC